MARYATDIAGTRYAFDGLRSLLAKATPRRSGDELAGLAAETDTERVAARLALADMPLKAFLQDLVIPYETDEVTRLIVDGQDATAFAPISAMTVGEFRDWLLSYAATSEVLATIARGVTPEMAAAVSKLMRNQDLVAVARKCRVVTAFRSTIGLPGRLATRLQPNHPTDDARGVAAATLDGLLLGAGDAVIGINPATDNLRAELYRPSSDHARCEMRVAFRYPDADPACWQHVTHHAMRDDRTRAAPVDLVFQSIAGTRSCQRAALGFRSGDCSGRSAGGSADR